MDTNPSADGPRELRPLVEWLTGIGVTDHWVISCYLKLEPRDRTRGKYLIKLKNRIKTRLAWLDEHEPDRARRESAARDLDRVREYLEHSGSQVEGRGVAIFACEALDLFEVIALPQVTGASWECVAAGGATCTAGPVVGDISDTVNLSVGGTAT